MGDSLSMLGDSLTDWGDWNELLEREVANHGIAGDTIAGARRRLGAALAERPRVLALLIGINDLLNGASAPAAADAILDLAREVRQRAPETRLLVQSLLPTGGLYGALNAQVDEINARLAAAADEIGYGYVEVNEALRGSDGNIDPRYTTDGVHLSRAGYRAWAEVLSGMCSL